MPTTEVRARMSLDPTQFAVGLDTANRVLGKFERGLSYVPKGVASAFSVFAIGRFIEQTVAAHQKIDQLTEREHAQLQTYSDAGKTFWQRLEIIIGLAVVKLRDFMDVSDEVQRKLSKVERSDFGKWFWSVPEKPMPLPDEEKIKQFQERGKELRKANDQVAHENQVMEEKIGKINQTSTQRRLELMEKMHIAAEKMNKSLSSTSQHEKARHDYDEAHLEYAQSEKKIYDDTVTQDKHFAEKRLRDEEELLRLRGQVRFSTFTFTAPGSLERMGASSGFGGPAVDSMRQVVNHQAHTNNILGRIERILAERRGVTAATLGD